VFQAAGLLTYDMVASRFTWVSSGGTGHLGVSEAVVNGSSFVWSMSDGKGKKSRFTISLTAAGEWYDIGEESTDDATWTKTIEMKMVKR